MYKFKQTYIYHFFLLVILVNVIHLSINILPLTPYIERLKGDTGQGFSKEIECLNEYLNLKRKDMVKHSGNSSRISKMYGKFKLKQEGNLNEDNLSLNISMESQFVRMSDDNTRNNFYFQNLKYNCSKGLHSNLNCNNSLMKEPFLSECLPISQYYPFTADQEVCDSIRSNQAYKAYGLTYNFTCSTDFRKGLLPREVDLTQVHINVSSLHKGLLNRDTHSPIVLMNVYKNSLISPKGKLLVQGLEIKTEDCLLSQKPSNLTKFAFHEEVYVISQHWGASYFHKLVENMPRLVVFLKFLKINPQIKILCADDSENTRQLLQVLGLNSSRIIKGWVMARVAYLPRSTQCGNANFLETQLLNQIFRKYTLQNILKKRKLNLSKIILIQRSRSRRLLEHAAILKELEATAKEHNLQVYVHKDNPPAPLNETMAAFAEAVVVVAPHGAGLANLLFSQPGTLVLEVLVNVRTPDFNLCYHRLSYGLGMKWYGMSSQKKGTGVVSIQPDIIKKLLNTFFKETYKLRSVKV